MRINKYVALGSQLSRRAADIAIGAGRVVVNGQPAQLGQEVAEHDSVLLDGRRLQLPAASQTILFHKPVGYVVSRDGQGSQTIYDLLPPQFQHLQPVGRLDKYSSGLLVLTNDGQLAQQLTHPKYGKTKIYEVTLDKPLQPNDQAAIAGAGVQLEDGLSRLDLTPLPTPTTANAQQPQLSTSWRIRMQEGRNRQIRRTFSALGYQVTRLRRTAFGAFQLSDQPPGANWPAAAPAPILPGVRSTES